MSNECSGVARGEKKGSSLASKTLYAIASKGSVSTINLLVQRLIEKFAPPFFKSWLRPWNGYCSKFQSCSVLYLWLNRANTETLVSVTEISIKGFAIVHVPLLSDLQQQSS